MSKNVNRMLTTRDVAEALQVSLRWVQLRCDNGSIRAIRLCGESGPYRIYPEELSRLRGELPERQPSRADYREADLAMARLGLLPLDEDDPRRSQHRSGSCLDQNAPAASRGHRSQRPYRSRVGRTCVEAGKE